MSRTNAQSLVSWLAAVVRAQPERPAVLFGSDVWTYRDLWKRAERIAYALLGNARLSPQSRVGLIGRNDPNYLAAYLGILRAGCVAVPLNQMLKPEELKAQLTFAGAAGCILGDVDGDAAEALAGEHQLWAVDDLNQTQRATLPRVGPSSKSSVLLTSGSTGVPKGVVHCHAMNLHAATLIAAAFHVSRDDVSIAFLPFFASIPEQALPILLSGAALYVLPRFDPEAVCRACSHATTFDAVPTIMARLLEHGDFEQLNKLRWIMFASEPMPPALLGRWWERVPGAKTYELYGMTEMLTITYATPELLQGEPRCVGVPFSTSAVAVLDEEGHALPPGTEGEIVCASPARMVGYFEDPASTASVLTPGGAMRTGDAGRFDGAGRLHLTGRFNDLIISGGLNLAPAEIEAVACRHPLVAAASVVGIPDERWGETPVVIAVPRRGASLGARELLSYCRAELAAFKRPSAAVIVEALPSTGIGKSAKTELRQAILSGELKPVRAEDLKHAAEVNLEPAR